MSSISDMVNEVKETLKAKKLAKECLRGNFPNVADGDHRGFKNIYHNDRVLFEHYSKNYSQLMTNYRNSKAKYEKAKRDEYDQVVDKPSAISKAAAATSGAVIALGTEYVLLMPRIVAFVLGSNNVNKGYQKTFTSARKAMVSVGSRAVDKGARTVIKGCRKTWIKILKPGDMKKHYWDMKKYKKEAKEVMESIVEAAREHI